MPLPPSLRAEDLAARTSTFTKTSVFQSNELTIAINSPTTRTIYSQDGHSLTLPVLGEHDRVGGTVTVHPQGCLAPRGRLTLMVEGVFDYISPMSATKAGPTQITPGKHRHVFYSESLQIPLSASTGRVESRKRPALRFAMNTIRRVTSQERLRNRPSLKKAQSMDSEVFPKRHSARVHGRANSSSSGWTSESTTPSVSGTSSSRSSSFWFVTTESPCSSPSSSPRTFKFEFELPKEENGNGELPPTFSCSNVVSAGVRGRVYKENADARYNIRALWEALDGSGTQAVLDIPFLYLPDMDFHSLDGTSESWTEVSLKNSDGLPVECAVTLPDPAAFSRRASIPYFVVFTTKPRSRALSAEIMADATIAVSLVRRVGFSKPARGPHLEHMLQQQSMGGLSRNKLRATASSVDLARKNYHRHAIWIDTSSPEVLPQSPTTSTSETTNTVSAASSPSSTTSRKPFGSRRGARLLKRVVRSAPPILGNIRFSRPAESGSSLSVNSSCAGSSGCEQDCVDYSTSGNISVYDKPLPRLPTDSEPPSPTSSLGTSLSSFSLRRHRSRTMSQQPRPTGERERVEYRSQYAAAAAVPNSGTNLINSAAKPAALANLSANERPMIYLTDSRTLHTDVSVGFPKRPKGRTPDPGSHPSLAELSALPDGLYKGCIPLQREWLPSIKWRALSVEYFLQVSVIFDNSEFKGRVPLQIY